MKLSSRLSAAALTIAASLAMGADQSALAQHSGEAANRGCSNDPPVGGERDQLRSHSGVCHLSPGSGSALLTRAASRSIPNASRP